MSTTTDTTRPVRSGVFGTADAGAGTKTTTGRESQSDAVHGLSVLIVDDHPLYRAGMTAALAPLPIRCREAATLMTAIDALEREAFDLVLYDWHLPDGGGCKGLAAIRQLATKVPVVVISADEDEAIEVAAHCMGAAARITKAQDAAGIRAVVSGILQCAGVAGASLAPDPASAAEVPIELTQRQRDVLQQMASGEPNKRIATALGIAESTVRAHVSDILELLHARNRTEAVIRAHRASLLALGR